MKKLEAGSLYVYCGSRHETYETYVYLGRLRRDQHYLEFYWIEGMRKFILSSDTHMKFMKRVV